MGYPRSIGLEYSPQFDYDQPLLRNGIVAGTYPERGTIILDGPVYYGNSGGPVVDVVLVTPSVAKVSLIGVITEFIPFENKHYRMDDKNSISNSGYSVCVCMDVFAKLLQ